MTVESGVMFVSVQKVLSGKPDKFELNDLWI